MPVEATICHNPNCGTSRKVLGILKERPVVVTPGGVRACRPAEGVLPLLG